MTLSQAFGCTLDSWSYHALLGFKRSRNADNCLLPLHRNTKTCNCLPWQHWLERALHPRDARLHNSAYQIYSWSRWRTGTRMWKSKSEHSGPFYVDFSARVSRSSSKATVYGSYVLPLSTLLTHCFDKCASCWVVLPISVTTPRRSLWLCVSKTKDRQYPFPKHLSAYFRYAEVPKSWTTPFPNSAENDIVVLWKRHWETQKWSQPRTPK